MLAEICGNSDYSCSSSNNVYRDIREEQNYTTSSVLQIGSKDGRIQFFANLIFFIF